MNEPELRLLRGIRDSLAAIQKEIRAIRDKYESNNEYNKPDTPSPVINAELQTPEHIERSNQSNANRDYRLQVWLIIGTWLAFIAAAVYAGISRVQLGEIQKQTEISESQYRPWLKITDVTVDAETGDLPVLFFSAFQYSGQRITTVAPSLDFHVKNIGRSVARDVFINPNVRFHQTLDINKVQGGVCDGARKGVYPVVQPPFAWTAIFPDDEVSFRVAVGSLYQPADIYHFPEKDKRPGDWISGTLIGCVMYQRPLIYQTSAVFILMGDKDRFF